MAEVKTPAVRIGKLNLRIPGDDPQMARRVADGLAENLARKVPAGMRSEIGSLDVRVRVPAGASDAEMSEAISEAILKALHRGGRAADYI